MPSQPLLDTVLVERRILNLMLMGLSPVGPTTLAVAVSLSGFRWDDSLMSLSFMQGSSTILFRKDCLNRSEQDPNRSFCRPLLRSMLCSEEQSLPSCESFLSCRAFKVKLVGLSGSVSIGRLKRRSAVRQASSYRFASSTHIIPLSRGSAIFIVNMEQLMLAPFTTNLLGCDLRLFLLGSFGRSFTGIKVGGGGGYF